MGKLLYLETSPAPHECTCATGMRSIRCRACTCCAVFQRRDEGKTRTCTSQRGHAGEHRDS